MGIAHCREAMARIARRDGADESSKVWADQSAWWEGQAANDCIRADARA